MDRYIGNQRQYFDIRFNFRELFNPQTGFSLRTGILGKDSRTGNTIDTGVDPFMRTMPAPTADCRVGRTSRPLPLKPHDIAHLALELHADQVDGLGVGPVFGVTPPNGNLCTLNPEKAPGPTFMLPM